MFGAALLLAWLAWNASEPAQPNDLTNQSLQHLDRGQAKQAANGLVGPGSGASRLEPNGEGWTAVYGTSESQLGGKATHLCVDLSSQGKRVSHSASYLCR
jgi:hypothetical protein